MHELSIAKTLFEEARQMAFKLRIDRISRIKIKMGVASGIDIDMLKHSLIDHMFPESIAEDAQIEITLEPLIAKCKQCGNEITQVGISGGCPKCSSRELDIISGIKVVIEDVE
ncbi:MAG: hypothetical protein COW11_01640 [Candidatus Omnitrophica bacterium CG12_big_fil_rev_8_21_14_0_65_43_15]|uniref:Hydrogenase maturation factor HypA n=1 Tax=Candidatus Taenaricola geysiri TaxID=1974752 RepID=A0A2J0LSF6_9BACT|nr:MAG: hypothetical protein AUJ89_01985 [Candidatus Omnitrophica bacterium CG1_02_43_210]PIR66203.1 MAG: hypothetical protein COU52_00080 [Candidatus Omnitrophica bacterium CG10_big_fil_rev_8_21_14_0_10_43_8]PIV11859.1 MAG: hypothetical protein COS48_03605 [Candidatus Omnitrophica bacterium CG03_land_8_20_14_0_80_43_22]PIW66777.1 MAG: hypothetical protein COW11_01640 [Candidatus Omnitrophica bacterium CG12_big_fil_rev_8_21_14_0_65_43_15]PIW80312.1 MAG: hypothetical protein COZ98_03015 [Candida